MTNNGVVYTLTNECHDCYKCIRECRVKAIKIENGHASVIPDRCIACGLCVRTCPAGAKKVRNDLADAKNLFLTGRKVYVSLAPSWRAAFDLSESQVVALFKRLGFSGVGETAVGAEEVSIETAKVLNGAQKGLFISSACPVAVDFIRCYHPDFSYHITQIASPAQTHAKLLKEREGADVDVVFVGPCIGKKNESDRHPDLLSAALTFEEIKIWMNDDGVKVEELNDEGEGFMPRTAYEGALYPLNGGMIETIKRVGVRADVQMTAVSSLDSIEKALTGLDPSKLESVVFLELLACDGGCVAGPCVDTQKSGLENISAVIAHAKRRNVVPQEPEVVVPLPFPARPVVSAVYTVEDVNKALERIGKFSAKDELNCGGCGYATCRGLAKALLSGMAEPSMCVSYMRKIALRKATAMLRCMPSAAVIVDGDLNIVEANDAFMRLFTGEQYELYQALPDGLAGAELTKVADFSKLFKATLKSGKDIHRERFPLNSRLYDVTAFTIEKNALAGAIITDVTETAASHEQIARKAHEVITKNISIVQEIACLLGEHMVETESLLSSIAQDYDETADDSSVDASAKDENSCSSTLPVIK